MCTSVHGLTKLSTTSYRLMIPSSPVLGITKSPLGGCAFFIKSSACRCSMGRMTPCSLHCAMRSWQCDESLAWTAAVSWVLRRTRCCHFSVAMHLSMKSNHCPIVSDHFVGGTFFCPAPSDGRPPRSSVLQEGMFQTVTLPSLPPAAMLKSSFETAKACSGDGARSAARNRPLSVSYTRTVRSFEALMRNCPSVVNLTAVTWAICSLKANKGEPSFDQVLTVRSAEHEARIVPSVDHATP